MDARAAIDWAARLCHQEHRNGTLRELAQLAGAQDALLLVHDEDGQVNHETSLNSHTNMSANAAYSGRGFLYALALSGSEDMLKVGMTRDPLARWTAFHPRWFEAFDLDHSLLVETETRADAQALETTLHRLLVDHQCPMPLTMRLPAGGSTEWYRGAYSAARGFVMATRSAGHVIHVQASTWLAPGMATEREHLFSAVHQAFEDHCSGWLSPVQLTALRDAVDAQRAFGTHVEAWLPAQIREALGLGFSSPHTLAVNDSWSNGQS